MEFVRKAAFYAGNTQRDVAEEQKNTLSKFVKVPKTDAKPRFQEKIKAFMKLTSHKIHSRQLKIVHTMRK